MPKKFVPFSGFDVRAESSRYKCRATQVVPRMEILIPGEPVFLDIEFEKFKRDGHEKEQERIGRICIVNSGGEIVLDVYAAYPDEESIERRHGPRWIQDRFNVRTKDLLVENGAVPGLKVEAWVKEIIRDRRVVLHGGKNDKKAFFYEMDIWSSCTSVDDTQYLYGQVKLSTLAYEYLGLSIQVEDVHSPDEDANAARLLWQLRYPYDRAAEARKHGITLPSPAVVQHAIVDDVGKTNGETAYSKETGMNSNKGNSLHARKVTPLSGQGIMTAKPKPQQRSRKVEVFKDSIDDEEAFPALGR